MCWISNLEVRGYHRWAWIWIWELLQPFSFKPGGVGGFLQQPQPPEAYLGRGGGMGHCARLKNQRHTVQSWDGLTRPRFTLFLSSAFCLNHTLSGLKKFSRANMLTLYRYTKVSKILEVWSVINGPRLPRTGRFVGSMLCMKQKKHSWNKERSSSRGQLYTFGKVRSVLLVFGQGQAHYSGVVKET